MKRKSTLRHVNDALDSMNKAYAAELQRVRDTLPADHAFMAYVDAMVSDISRIENTLHSLQVRLATR